MPLIDCIVSMLAYTSRAGTRSCITYVLTEVSMYRGHALHVHEQTSGPRRAHNSNRPNIYVIWLFNSAGDTPHFCSASLNPLSPQ